MKELQNRKMEMNNQNDSVDETNANEDNKFKPIAVKLLRSLELMGLRVSYSSLKKAYSTDGWWILREDEVTGPHAFNEVLQLLIEGAGSLAVVHESLANEENAPWHPLSYNPKWMNPRAVFFWKIGLGALSGLLLFLLVRFLVPLQFATRFNLVLAPMVFIGILAQFPGFVQAVMCPIRGTLFQAMRLASTRNVMAVAFIAVVGLGGVGYRRVPVVRDRWHGAVLWVEAITDNWKGRLLGGTAPVAAREDARPPVENQAAATPTPLPYVPIAAGEEPTPTPGPVATPPPVDEMVGLVQLSLSRSEWPKTVVLKTAVVFPAVLNGKVVGSVKTAPGTQARLIMVQPGKISVEYRGGSVMVDAKETDLIEQVQANRHGHPGYVPATVETIARTAPSPSQNPASTDNALPGLGVKPR